MREFQRRMNADYLVFWFTTCAICFVLGMAVQHREGEPIILIEPQKPAPRIQVKVTDCEQVADAVVWCRAGKRLAKVRN